MPKKPGKSSREDNYVHMKDEITNWQSKLGDDLKKMDCYLKFERCLDVKFYRTCLNKNLTLKINDFVLICTDPHALDADRPEKCAVAEILFMYKHFDDDFKGDRCRAIVRWFGGKSDLPKKVKTDLLDYEVFNDGRKWDPEISVETVVDHCHIEMREVTNTSMPTKTGAVNWICRYTLEQVSISTYNLASVMNGAPLETFSNRRTPLKKNTMALKTSPEKTPLKLILKKTINNEGTPRTKSIMKTPNSDIEGRTPRGRKRVSICPVLETHQEPEDEENVTPPKQKRSNDGTPKGRKSRQLSDKKTPRAKSLLSQFTLEQRATPVVSDGEQMHIARERLHVAAVPKALPCREKEFREIYSFLEDKLLDDCGGCVYISGVPGTGKTATTTEVIRTLQAAAKKGDVPAFDFIDINGMRLTEPRQAYVQIYRQLSAKTVSWEHAYQLLDKRFNTPAPRRQMTIMLVDELDILCNRRQDVVYNILNWPTLNAAKLVVVTIANTMDLPERLLMGKITSRLGLTRLTFQAYNFQQLQEIIQARIAGTETFNRDAVQLVARKVAAVSGDCRRALDICRRAAEIAEAGSKSTGKVAGVVSIGDVQQALTEMIASPKMQFIKSCTKYEKLWLQAVCAEVSRTGLEEVVFNSVYTQFEIIVTFSRFFLPSVEQAIGICTRLGSCRLLVCEHGRKDLYMKILLNVSADDIHYALNSK